MHQVNGALGEEFLNDTSARFQGICEWTVNIGGLGAEGRRLVQIKFGPSAWYANEGAKETDQEDPWKKRVPAADADYSRLFLTWRGEVRQSSVSLQEVLDGISADDLRLGDEIVDLVQESQGGDARRTRPNVERS